MLVANPHDGDLQIIARTDARASAVFPRRSTRPHCVDAGANVTFVERQENLEELTKITKSTACRNVPT